MPQPKLKIAIQKSGRLSEDSLALFKESGIKFSNGQRKLRTMVIAPSGPLGCPMSKRHCLLEVESSISKLSTKYFGPTLKSTDYQLTLGLVNLGSCGVVLGV